MLTGICFRRYRSNVEQSLVERIIRILMAILYISLVIYVIVCFGLMSLEIIELENGKNDVVRTLILSLWMTQSIVGMVCF
jgi:hypothetical protein